MRSRSASNKLYIFCVAMFCWAWPAHAQQNQECDTGSVADGAQLQIIRCGEAISLERELTANLRIVERSDVQAPRVIEVEGGAIFIEVAPGHERTQVRTPHAIATVRGTIFIVDAGTEETSVFVLEGGVDVRRPNNLAFVTVRAGEGIDVSPGSRLAPRVWGAARRDALLARFGR